jgi:hypothetical protein
VDPLSLVAVAAALAGLVLTVLNIREKLWPKVPAVHPLDDRLRDIASAIREKANPE